MATDEGELKIRQHASNQRTLLLGLALVAIVLGVVVPLGLDTMDRAQRGETITQIEEVVRRLDERDSPEAQQELRDIVDQLTAIISCDNRANLDLLLDELVNRELIPAGGLLACVESPFFTYPPTTGDQDGD